MASTNSISSFNIYPQTLFNSHSKSKLSSAFQALTIPRGRVSFPIRAMGSSASSPKPDKIQGLFFSLGFFLLPFLVGGFCWTQFFKLYCLQYFGQRLLLSFALYLLAICFMDEVREETHAFFPFLFSFLGCVQICNFCWKLRRYFLS